MNFLRTSGFRPCSTASEYTHTDFFTIVDEGMETIQVRPPVASSALALELHRRFNAVTVLCFVCWICSLVFQVKHQDTNAA